MKIATLALAFLSAGLMAGFAVAQPVGNEMSSGVTWEAHGPDTRPVGARRLTAAEVKFARERAARLFEAVKAAPSFRQPAARATLFTSAAAIEPADVLQQSFTAYWSVPRDVRRRPDGILTPALGGAHDLLYFESNLPPAGSHLEDRATRGDFSRKVENGVRGGYFAQPRTFGELGGGTIYADMITFTRDGRSALAPAPIGVLLEIEIARLKEAAASAERGTASRLKELEASMTPEKIAERRAARERAWSRETRDPAALAKRLDAAHRNDESSYEREKRDFTPPAQPDPRHRFWGPKLALESAERTLAALDAAGRQAPACGRVEPGFSSHLSVRFEVAGSAPNCVPMVQVRPDLVDPRRPLEEVQLMTVWFRGSQCGEHWGGKPLDTRGGRCANAVPLLREMDWAAARKALGW